MQNKMFCKMVVATLSMLLICTMSVLSVVVYADNQDTPVSTTINTKGESKGSNVTSLSSINTTTGPAITLSKNKVMLSDKLNIKIENGNSNANIGFYSSSDTPSASNSKIPQIPLSSIITSGNGSYDLDLSTLKANGVNIEPGTYNIVVYEVLNNIYTVEGSANIEVIKTPSINVSKSIIEAGNPKEEITITDGSIEPDAWIGLYPVDVVPGTQGSMYYWYLADSSSGDRYLNIQNGNGTATLDLSSYVKAGNTYKLVLFDDDKGSYTSHASVTFQVVDKIGPGITLSKATRIGTQETINAKIASASVDQGAWLAIYNQSDVVDSNSTSLWKDTLTSLTNGNGLDTQGNGNFSVDLSKISNLKVNSQYKIVLFKDAGYNVVTSENFDTMLPSIKMNAPNLKLGDKAAVTITNGSDDPNAWVGIYHNGKVPGKDEAPIWYKSLADLNVQKGNVTFDLDTEACNMEPGKTYSLILFKDGAYKMDSSVDFTIAGAQLLNDATLAGIEVNGNVLNDFITSTKTYNVKLPYGTISVPTVSALSSVVGAKLDITQASSVNGISTIKVTALDGATTDGYTVNFNVDSQVPINPNNASIVNVGINTVISNNQVNVAGNINTGSGENVIIKCLDPDGNIAYLDETTSEDNGRFVFDFTTNNVQNGSYNVKIAGDRVQTPYQQTFLFTNTQPAPYIPPAPQSETREIPVGIGNGGQQSTAVQIPVTRVTDTDGTKKDSLQFDENKAKETVAKALETKTNTANINVTDIPGNNADKVEVQIPQNSMSELGNNNISLNMETEKVSLELPNETISGLKDKDIKIQISDEKDSSEVAETKGLIMQLASGSQVITTPLKVEANFTGRTKITLPIDASKLPTSKEELEKFLSSLAVVVQHSDGENTVDKGTVEYDSSGNPIGISIWVNKFSTFTLVKLTDNYFNGRITVMPDKVAPDKQWNITFTKEADKSSLTPENIYVLDSKGNKVDIKISYDSDNILKVTPVNPYKSGETYNLYISNKITSKNKTQLTEALRYEFTIK